MANFDTTPTGGVRRAAPLIGQDTEDVLAELDELEFTTNHETTTNQRG